MFSSDEIGKRWALLQSDRTDPVLGGQRKIAKAHALYENSRSPEEGWYAYLLAIAEPIDEDSTTRIVSYAENRATEVQEQLIENGHGTEVEFQGSVPLNVHIKAFSDLDSLIIETTTHQVVDRLRPSDVRFLGDSLTELKGHRERIVKALLKDNYRDEINEDGRYAVKLIKRGWPTMDFVGAVRYHSEHFRDSGDVAHLGVAIYDAEQHRRDLNLPRLHNRRIDEHDCRSNEATRPLIRGLKSLRSHSWRLFGRSINLTSYDIMSLVYRISPYSLSLVADDMLDVYSIFLSQAKSWLANPTILSSLMVPNETRPIFGNDKVKFTELSSLVQDLEGALLLAKAAHGRKIAQSIRANLMGVA